MPTVDDILEIQIAGSLFVALIGLAFGSFLNVVLVRLPQSESIVLPGSHCRSCEHALAWWENIPLLSWIVLRGRCRICLSSISPRYPLVELTVAILWTALWLAYFPALWTGSAGALFLTVASRCLFAWLLVALAVLDAEHLWLPDYLTWTGIASGIVYAFAVRLAKRADLVIVATNLLVAILAAAAIVLVIRLAYWLIRRREGMGLGDAKLMAMLGAWLGLRGALDCFVLAIFAASAAALLWLPVHALSRKRPASQTDAPQDEPAVSWAAMPLPLGSFLCAAALLEMFYPDWLWLWWTRTFLL